jgi:hypothetical protein
MKGERISSTPIQEFRDTMLNPAYFRLFEQYLDNVCQCTCTALEDESIVVHFPDGTMEEEYVGRSTPWRRETTIRLPNGVKLIKRVHTSTQEGEKVLAALILPKAAFSHKNDEMGIEWYVTL